MMYTFKSICQFPRVREGSYTGSKYIKKFIKHLRIFYTIALYNILYVGLGKEIL